MLAKLLPLFLLFSLLCFNRAWAQTDTTAFLPSYIVQQYVQNRGDNLLLYNGVEYAHSYPHTTGHPFFLTDTFQQSSLLYEGVLYQNVPLAYDLVSNAVVIKNKDQFLIELKNEKIDWFNLQHHFFVSLSSELKSDVLKEGIYEIYDYGKIAVFIRREKVVKQAANPADLDYFTQYDYYFIKKNNNFFPVKNSKALLTVFDDKKDEIKAYLHQNHLNFKKNQEATLLKAAAYYAQIKK